MSTKPLRKINIEAKNAAFAIAFNENRTPGDYKKLSNTELLPKIRLMATSASDDDCWEALVRVRTLCDDIYQICTAYREGKFGTDPNARQNALKELYNKNPGFTIAEYEKAFNTGLTWIAS